MDRVKRHAISFILFIVSFCIIFYVFNDYKNVKKQFHPDHPQDVYMTIFVHGTFSPILGFLSTKKVLADDLKNTTYRTVSKKMRDDDFFFQDQPILARGLQKVIPTFSINSQTSKRLAAYPLIKAFEEVYNSIPNHQSVINHFYTFGWSGLISQNKRRLDALRFFNCLAEEWHQLKIIHNKAPKIRIVAHSHGGNLCLNLAAINHLLEKKLTLDPATSKDQFESLEKMLAVITTMSPKNTARTHKGLTHFDYQPEQLLPQIDELVLYATPIQPETEPFFASSFFKNVYHLYSQDDLVQQLDGISTKESHSNQRLNDHLLSINNKNHKIIQCRIMYDQNLEGIPSKNNNDSQKNKSLWSKVFERIFTGKESNSTLSKDPAHKDFWFLAWRSETPTTSTELSPLPLVTLTGMFTHLLDDLNNTYDVDINMTFKNNNLVFTSLKHDTHEILKTASIEGATITHLKNNIMPWKPIDFSTRSAFNTIYKLFIKNTPVN